FTPRDQKAVKSAAETFRRNPKVDVEVAITELGVGEALVSFLDEKGIPTPVERTFVCPPGSRIGPATDGERMDVVKSSSVFSFYEKNVDRESAYEILKVRAEQTATEAQAEEGFDWGGILGGDKKKSSSSRSDSVIETAAKSAARAIGSQLGRQIIRGVLGSILGGRK
ncbi:MAG TPA: helicase HerA-like domain-containing protein, partial [Methylotenera sp.]|nr:helicase HerA-like domain-containing protein [Methylotenera sp.]